MCPVCGSSTVEERLPGIHGKTHKQDRCPTCMWIGPPVFMGGSAIDNDGPGGEDEAGPDTD